MSALQYAFDVSSTSSNFGLEKLNSFKAIYDYIPMLENHTKSNTVTIEKDLITDAVNKYITAMVNNDRQNALNLFGQCRELTPAERIEYKKGILKAYNRTGRNKFDLL